MLWTFTGKFLNIVALFVVFLRKSSTIASTSRIRTSFHWLALFNDITVTLIRISTKNMTATKPATVIKVCAISTASHSLWVISFWWHLRDFPIAICCSVSNTICRGRWFGVTCCRPFIGCCCELNIAPGIQHRTSLHYRAITYSRTTTDK